MAALRWRSCTATSQLIKHLPSVMATEWFRKPPFFNHFPFLRKVDELMSNATLDEGLIQGTSVSSILDSAFDAGGGLLRLTPTWVQTARRNFFFALFEEVISGKNSPAKIVQKF